MWWACLYQLKGLMYVHGTYYAPSSLLASRNRKKTLNKMVINYCPVIVKSTRRHWNIALRIQGQMGFWYSSNLRRLTKIALISWESNDLTAPQRVSLLHSQSELLRVPRLYRNGSQTAGCQNEQSQVKGSVIFTKVDQEYPIYTKEILFSVAVKSAPNTISNDFRELVSTWATGPKFESLGKFPVKV